MSLLFGRECLRSLHNLRPPSDFVVAVALLLLLLFIGVGVVACGSPEMHQGSSSVYTIPAIDQRVDTDL
jgi:hypothetical protein